MNVSIVSYYFARIKEGIEIAPFNQDDDNGVVVAVAQDPKELGESSSSVFCCLLRCMYGGVMSHKSFLYKSTTSFLSF